MQGHALSCRVHTARELVSAQMQRPRQPGWAGILPARSAQPYLLSSHDNPCLMVFSDSCPGR